MALVCAVSMSIEKYFKRSQEKILPSPHGSLSLSVPSRAIAAANKEVGRVSLLRQQSSASATTISKKRGKYNKYSPEERAMIGKHAVLYGNLSAKRSILALYNVDILHVLRPKIILDSIKFLSEFNFRTLVL